MCFTRAAPRLLACKVYSTHRDCEFDAGGCSEDVGILSRGVLRVTTEQLGNHQRSGVSGVLLACFYGEAIDIFVCPLQQAIGLIPLFSLSSFPPLSISGAQRWCCFFLFFLSLFSIPRPFGYGSRVDGADGRMDVQMDAWMAWQ